MELKDRMSGVLPYQKKRVSPYHIYPQWKMINAILVKYLLKN